MAERPLARSEDDDADVEGGVFAGMAAACKLSAKMTVAEVRKRPLEYVIGLFAVFTVVGISALILDAIGKSPVLFIKLAEEKTGEMDMMMLSDMTHSSNPFLNYTARRALLNETKVRTAPRWFITASARRKYGQNSSVGCTVLVLNSRNEEAQNIGRTWGHRVLGEGEAHVKDTMLRQLGIQAEVGEHIVVTIDFQRFVDDYGAETEVDILDAFGFGASAGSLDTRDETSGQVKSKPTLPVIQLDLDVVGEISLSEGKYPAAIGNAIVIDSHHLVRTVMEQICYFNQRRSFEKTAGIALPELRTIAEAVKLDEYAVLIQALFENRKDIFMKSAKEMQLDVVQASDEIVLLMGDRTNDTLEYPLPNAMVGFAYLRLFLDQIFNCIVITIMILGCILIYSLLMASISKRTYEHGMLRALGFRKTHLINLISIQALSFAIPGVALGMFFALIGSIVIEKKLSVYSGFDPEYGKMRDLAVGIPITLGFVVPIAANIIPIRRALGNTLRAALDISHQSSSVTSVTMTKLESMGLKLWQTCLALFLVVSGFTVYYMMPYSFIFDELWLFFFILLMILLCMLFGLCIISMTLQSMSEKMCLKLLLWGPERRLGTLVSKNLTAHRERSSKTFVMFAISTASIIFGGVVFTLQAESIENNIRLAVGSDIQVRSLDIDEPLPHKELEEFLQKRAAENPMIKSWAFSTFRITEYTFIDSIEVSNMLSFPMISLAPVGIDIRYLEAVYDDFFIIQELQGGVARDELFASLYSSYRADTTYRPPQIYSGIPPEETHVDIHVKYENLVPVIASYAAKDTMSLNVENTLRFMMLYLEGDQTVETLAGHYLAQPRALISKLPGWLTGASSYAFLLKGSPLLMSIPSFTKVLDDCTTEAYVGQNITKMQRLFVRFADDTSDADREAVVSELKSFLHREKHVVLDTAELIDSTHVAIDILMAFFYSMSAVSLFLNILLLWISFTDNVSHNQWMFAVMRSLGFSCSQLVRAFVYEALCTVLCAFAFGSIIGIAIAVTLTAQYNMFLELPLEIQMPWALLATVFVEAIFAAVLGSWWPAQVLCVFFFFVAS